MKNLQPPGIEHVHVHPCTVDCNRCGCGCGCGCDILSLLLPHHVEPKYGIITTVKNDLEYPQSMSPEWKPDSSHMSLSSTCSPFHRHVSLLLYLTSLLSLPASLTPPSYLPSLIPFLLLSIYPSPSSILLLSPPPPYIS